MTEYTIPDEKTVRKFYKNKDKINDFILDFFKRDDNMPNVIYGSQAVNKQLPKFLRVHSNDIDSSSEDPVKEAEQLTNLLNEWFGEKIFFVKPAKHPGTFKVKNLVDLKGYADLSKKPEPIPFVDIDGNKWATLEYSLSMINKAIADPSEQALDRRKKDLDARNRVQLGLTTADDIMAEAKHEVA